MDYRRTANATLIVVAAIALTGCNSRLFNRSDNVLLAPVGESGVSENVLRQRESTPYAQNRTRSTVWDLFGQRDDPNVTVEVNKYIWNAALDVLNFLPIEAADPFSGVIVTGYGTPPGGGRAYRATIYIQDPALDARSLNVALQTRGGPASVETVRAIEDAILTRARELRISDSRL